MMITASIFALVPLALLLSQSTLGLECGECFAEGKDCKPQNSTGGCDWCAKVTGETVDPSQIPEGAKTLIKNTSPNTNRKYFDLGEFKEQVLIVIYFSRRSERKDYHDKKMR